jgi:hypothetical protein
MKLLDNQLDKPSLAKFGEEACRLFIARDFRELADTFGYALACDRDTAKAIESDFGNCLSCPSRPQNEQDSAVESVTVRHFQDNGTGLLAVVECVITIGREAGVLIELIAAKNGEDKNLYLEDINAVAPPSGLSG